MGPFELAMTRYASLSGDALAAPWTWRGEELSVRDALYRSLEDEQDALARSLETWRPGESERILALAQRAFGDLRGLLLGTDEGLLDVEPAQGEWSLRAVFRHMMGVEKSYAARVAYATHRRDDEPVRAPNALLPREEDVDVSGDVGRLLDRFASVRAQSDTLCVVPAGRMERPTVWADVDVDVRFRLHRFAGHLVEHTIQCEKTLEAIGHPPGEARRIVRRISALRGELEAIDDDEVLRSLDAVHEERAASLP